MKRSPLTRRTALRRTAMPRARRRLRTQSAERAAWKQPCGGLCACGCGRYAEHLERHHVIAHQRLRTEGRLDVEWDLRNSMLLHPLCHRRHTNAIRRIRIEQVPEAALAFAVDVLGEGPAAVYLGRYYDCEAA